MKTPQNEWMVAFTADRQYLAEIAVNILGDAGIDSYIVNKTDSVLLVGDIEVYVKQDMLIKAKHLLKDLEA
ncbi:MAG: DUF2007 domain-containing protein [Bacteroidales bacterium]|nr:DUF2007 domain-containing protein [Bacteroidales bacterium]